MTRVTGIAPQPYAVQIDASAGGHGGIAQTLNGRVAPGWHVLEVDVTLLSGTFNGAGVYLHWGPTSGIVHSDSTSFVTTLDITGAAPGTGTVNKLYKFRKLVNIIADSDLFQMFVASHWEGFGQSIASANSLKFHRAALRPASQAEIEARQAKLDLVTANANIASNAAASASNAASIASLTTTVSANFTSATRVNRNLLSNSTGLKGTAGWTNPGSWGAYSHPLWGHWFYRGFTGASGLTESFYTDEFTAYAGWTYYFSAVPYLYGLNAGTARFWLAFYNSSHAWIGERNIWFTSSDSYNRLSNSIAAPTGTAYARFGCSLSGAIGDSGYAEIGFWQAKVEFQGSTAWRGDGELTDTVSRVTTAEANISSNTFAIATESAARALLETNLRAALGAGSDNLVINTDFYNGLEGWVTGWDGNSGLPVTRGFADTDSVGGSAGAYSGAVRTAYVRLTGTPAADTVVDGYTTRSWANLADLKRWAVRVPGAVRVHASMYMSAHRGKSRLIVCEFDATGTFVTENTWDGTANHNNFGSGNPANAERVGGFFTTNANTRYLLLIPRLVGVSGGNDPYLFYGWAMVAMASAQQTVPAPYVSGGLDRGIYSDVSDVRTALAAPDGSTALIALRADASGVVTGMEIISVASGHTTPISQIIMSASDIILAAEAINFGSNTIFEDAYDSFYTEAGGRRNRFGGPFPASGDLLEWFGPTTVALNSETKTNGYWAKGTDGKIYYGSAEIVAPTTDDQTKTGTAAFDNITTSGTTVHTMATIDLTVGASGYLELLSPLFYGPLSINQETGMTLSAGTDWFGQMIVTEQLQSGGTEYTLWTIPLQISDTGGGLFDFIFDPPVVKVLAQNVSGASRYRLKLQRTSGSNNVSGNGLQGKFTIRRTP